MIGHGGPLVSVLICSYNAENFINATLTSVLGQTYGNLEVLVLDNDSHDSTVEILRQAAEDDKRLKLFVGRENRGAYGGLNYLLERARGKYIAIQDHDDIWHREKIRRQLKFLEEHEEYIGCGTAMVNYYEKYDTFLLRRQSEVSNVAWHTSLVFRNSGLRYNASIRVGNDFHFMKNVLCENRKIIYNSHEPHVLRRIRVDQKNLSSEWINFANLKDILVINIDLLDKLALLNRLILPNDLVNYMLIKFVLRTRVLSLKEMKEDEILRDYLPTLNYLNTTDEE